MVRYRYGCHQKQSLGNYFCCLDPKKLTIFQHYRQLFKSKNKRVFFIPQFQWNLARKWCNLAFKRRILFNRRLCPPKTAKTIYIIITIVKILASSNLDLFIKYEYLKFEFSAIVVTIFKNLGNFNMQYPFSVTPGDARKGLAA